MTAIFRRELNAYFSSPIGYIFLSVFYVFAGFYFTAVSLFSGSASITPVFSSLFTIVLFLIPILTMRLLSEDQKYKTDQVLLTAPVSLTGLVMGKFLAAVSVYLLGLSATLGYGLIVNFFRPPNWGMILGNFVALFLLGTAFISIGMFISSLTESQVVAAIGGFSAALALLLISSLTSVATNPVIVYLLKSIDFNSRFTPFSNGLFDLGNIFFFLAATAIFVFLTIRMLEKRRWS